MNSRSFRDVCIGVSFLALAALIVSAAVQVGPVASSIAQMRATQARQLEETSGVLAQTLKEALSVYREELAVKTRLAEQQGEALVGLQSDLGESLKAFAEATRSQAEHAHAQAVVFERASEELAETLAAYRDDMQRRQERANVLMSNASETTAMVEDLGFLAAAVFLGGEEQMIPEETVREIAGESLENIRERSERAGKLLEAVLRNGPLY